MRQFHGSFCALAKAEPKGVGRAETCEQFRDSFIPSRLIFASLDLIETHVYHESCVYYVYLFVAYSVSMFKNIHILSSIQLLLFICSDVFLDTSLGWS